MSKEKPSPTPPELQPTLPGFVIEKLPGGFRKGRWVFASPKELAKGRLPTIANIKGLGAEVKLFRRVQAGEVDYRDKESIQQAIDEVVDYQLPLL